MKTILLVLITGLWPGFAEMCRESERAGFPPSVKSYEYRVINDIEFALVDGQSLKLDLYQPQSVKQPTPVIVWIHGGGFTGGDKANAHKYAWLFAQKGYAVASVNYRLLPAMYPAQLQDVKGAIRFLRAQAGKYNLDPAHVAVLGTSAGGSLACQAGVTCGETELEGTVGGNLEFSSCVQAAIDCFGSFSEENMKKTGFSASRGNHLSRLLGCTDINSEECWEKIRAMAPENHLDKKDAPFLILHGDLDHSVPLQNSIDFDKKLRAAGIPSTLIIAKGYDHDVRMVVKYFDEVMEFLDRYMRN